MIHETARARQAWADYLALGADRSLDRLAERYQSAIEAPSRRLKTLADWSRTFGWQARLQAIINEQIAVAEAAEQARIRDILETGFALAHERVAALKELAAKLHEELTTGGRLWLKEPKGIGGGENWKQVDVERFNSAELEQFRAILDDIAAETSGRAKVVRVDIEMHVRRRAVELGLDPDEAVEEVRRMLREGGNGTRG